MTDLKEQQPQQQQSENAVEPPFELGKWKCDLELSEKKEKKLELLKVSFGKVNIQNIELFKLLNTLVIPVQYSQSFYLQTFMLYTKYTRLAYFNDIMVGALAARQEMRKLKQTEEEKQADIHKEETSLYILTLGVLKPYRRYRIASQLLENLERKAKKHTEIKSLYLHVWSINQGSKTIIIQCILAGIKFYQNHGFEVDEILENYYNDIDPKDAYVLVKHLQ